MRTHGFPPPPLKSAQALFYLNAAIWLLFAMVSLMQLADQIQEQRMMYGIIALLMAGNAGAMAISGWLLGRQRRSFFFLALALLLVNIILTFTDQFGLFDSATLILDVIILGILISQREAYLAAR